MQNSKGKHTRKFNQFEKYNKSHSPAIFILIRNTNQILVSRNVPQNNTCVYHPWHLSIVIINNLFQNKAHNKSNKLNSWRQFLSMPRKHPLISRFPWIGYPFFIQSWYHERWGYTKANLLRNSSKILTPIRVIKNTRSK